MAIADITGWNCDAIRIAPRGSGISPGEPQPLKILHVLDHSAPVHSGYAFRSQSILNEQRRRGWSPVALTSPKHAAAWKLPLPCAESEEIGGVRYFRTALQNPGAGWSGEFQLMAALARSIARVVRREKPDLLHAHSPVLNALPALWAGRQLGLPVVYEIRAFWEDAAANRGTYAEGSPKYRTVRFLETWACRRAAQIVVICEGLRQDLAARGIAEEKLTVIPNGANPETFRAGEPDVALARRLGIAGKKVIGFIGSFNRYEGLDLLVRAAGRLAARWPDAVVLLAGGGEMERELRAQIAASRLEDRVILAGRVAHGEISGLYSLMDVVVYPRYSMRLTERVTPLKPLEAMAMGTPVVAGNVGGHRELVRHGETGILFAPGSLSSLLGALDGSKRREHLPLRHLWPAARLRNPFPPSVAIVRREEFLGLGGFNEALRGASCEDWEFLVRFLLAYRVVETPEPLTNYYETAASGSRDYRRMLPNTLSIVEEPLLSGLSPAGRAFWRRRIKSAMYYHAAVSARDFGDPAARYLWQSFLEWPFPDFVPQRFKTLALQVFKNLAHLGA